MHLPNSQRLIMGSIALILLCLGIWRIETAHNGLQRISDEVSGLPFRITAPEKALDGSRPLVLVAHGLAGSATVMEGFTTTLAQAGYVVASWDFDGHAGNPRPMSPNIYSDALHQNVADVLHAVVQLQVADTSRLAILGHSMGTEAALRFGQIHPATQATIAVSPVNTPVTPQLPRNLLLMAGELEPDFVALARDRLAEAGGSGGNMALGTARKFEIVPNVEHITIIFSPSSHTLALDWLNATFGVQPGALPYTDHRMFWYVLVILATILAATSLIPRPTKSPSVQQVSLQRRSFALILGSLSATLVLWLAGRMGLGLNELFGLRVGGYLMLWFFVAGSIGRLILAVPIVRPQRGELLSGLLIFVSLWLGIGLIGGRVWLPWLLIPQRLILWPLASLALLPWCWLLGELSAQGKAGTRLLWWVFQSVIMFSALLLAIKLTPALGFLMLLLPVFPLVLLFHVLPNSVQRGTWIFALSGTLYVSWMLLAVFPLQ